MSDNTSTFILKGGLDLVTPQLGMKPGMMTAGVNYEPAREGPGYSRIDGYERFDGMPKPSAQTYWILNFTLGRVNPQLGRVVTGVTSGAVGTLVAVVLSSGTWAGGTAVGHFVIRLSVGTFQATENLSISEPVAFTSGFSSGLN